MWNPGPIPIMMAKVPVPGPIMPSSRCYGSRTVRLLYIGGSAGMGTATCTSDELQGLRLGYNKSGYLFFSAAHDYTLYGIR